MLFRSQVSLRSAGSGSGGRPPSPPRIGSTGTISIAPVAAKGSIVYWDVELGDTLLRGFQAGTEPVRTIVRHSQVPGKNCIGCHSATPDGQLLAFSASTDPRLGPPSTIDFATAAGLVGPAAFMTPAAFNLTQRQQQHIPSFSRAHWLPGDRIMLSIYRQGAFGRSEIIWTDLEAVSEARGQGWDVVQRLGDSAEATGADFSPDGTQIVYASGPSEVGIIVPNGNADLRIVPYNQRQGGMSLPLAGASSSDFSEFMPSFSADSRWVVFARVPSFTRSGSNPQGEIYVLPAVGGAPVRLAANDPAQCTNLTSPGVYNTWPRWSPEARQALGRTYHWMLFTSQRLGGIRQLFMTALVEQGGVLTSHGAVHLWNQAQDRQNHTPSWEYLELVQ